MPLLGKVIKRAIHTRQKFAIRRGTPQQYQQKVLKRLLKAAKDTAFGRTYDFSAILKSENIAEQFATQVPMHNYNSMHARWWSRALRGEENVCWPGVISYFALSSGTSGAPSKHIPVSKEMLKAINKASFKLIFTMAHYDLPPETFEKGILMLGSSTQLKFDGNAWHGDMSGISASKIPFWLDRFYKPGKEIAATTSWEEKLTMIAREAPNWDISIICGIPAWVQIMLERIIEHNNLETIHDLWPNLKIYVHGGIAFTPYKKAIGKLFRDPMIYCETYMASEGCFAYKPTPHATGMKLILNNGIFYEFVPFNSENFDDNGELKPDARALTIQEVQAGTDYAILLSTCAGAWRYLIGDTIRFVNAQEHEIIITGRTKHFLSICGEHLSVDNMNSGLRQAADELGVDLREFTVQGVPYENLFAHQWYVGSPEYVDADALRIKLDEQLRAVNDDYSTERDHLLKEIMVECIPNDWFYEWLRMSGKEGDQYKFPRVMPREQFEAWQAFVQKKKSETAA